MDRPSYKIITKKENLSAIVFLVAYGILILATTSLIIKSGPFLAPECGNELCEEGETTESCPADCVEDLSYLTFPGFAVGSRTYSTNFVYETNTSRFYSDSFLDANVSYEGDHIWKLQIWTKGSPAYSVSFPYDAEGYSLDGDASDEYILYPRRMGQALKLTAWQSWWGPWMYDTSDVAFIYPGGNAFSPLIVVADEDDARIAAATNWPPKLKSVSSYNYNQSEPDNSRLRIRYPSDPVPAYSTKEYHAIYAVVHANTSRGEHAWQKALDLYKNWLDVKRAENNLIPDYPSEIKNAHGFYNVQLYNSYNFTWALTEYERRWNLLKEYMPIILFWGQYSNYGDPRFTVRNETGDSIYLPWNGTTPPQDQYRGIPPIEVGENLTMEPIGGYPHVVHRRYIPELLDFAKEVVEEGKYVGYYTLPRKIGSVRGSLQDPTLHDGRTNLQWFDDWNAIAEDEWHANIHYLDTIGASPDYGDPLYIAELVRDHFPQRSVTEMPNELFTSPMLVSGAISLGSGKGGPDKSLETLSGTDAFPVPGFGRYLLNDRIIFLGESNGDHYWWGTVNASGQYWSERQVFLLGAKFDVMHPEESPGVLDKIMLQAILERDRVGWWAREPRYFDTKGISRVTPEMKVTVFKDNHNLTMFAIDNWNATENISITYLGEEINISIPISPDTNEPPRLYIYELETHICGNGFCEAEETAASCPNDCPSSPSQSSSSGGSSPTPTAPSCIPDWQCGEWSRCINRMQTRTCNDVNNCNIQQNKPETILLCNPEQPNPPENEKQQSWEDQQFIPSINFVKTFIYSLLGIMIVVLIILFIQLRKSIFHLEKKEKEVMQLAKKSLH